MQPPHFVAPSKKDKAIPATPRGRSVRGAQTYRHKKAGVIRLLTHIPGTHVAFVRKNWPATPPSDGQGVRPVRTAPAAPLHVCATFFPQHIRINARNTPSLLKHALFVLLFSHEAKPALREEEGSVAALELGTAGPGCGKVQGSRRMLSRTHGAASQVSVPHSAARDARTQALRSIYRARYAGLRA